MVRERLSDMMPLWAALLDGDGDDVSCAHQRVRRQNAEEKEEKKKADLATFGCGAFAINGY